MVILDTDHLTLVQRQKGDEYERLRDRLEEVARSEKVCVTIISFEEQMRGWLDFVAKAGKSAKIVLAYERLHRLEQDYRGRTVLPFDEPAFATFYELVRSKIRIGTMDLKIAATALSLNATLLSRNLSDFRKVPLLRVEDCSR